MYKDKIVGEEDFGHLFSLSNNADFSIALYEIFVNRYDKDINSLNPIQLNLFLCIQMENAGQADGILTFLQEWFPEYQNQIIESLNEIGATKSAEIIAKAVELLPENGSWFFESSSESPKKLIGKLDNEFSNYPDGVMNDLYRKYAEKHRSKIEK